MDQKTIVTFYKAEIARLQMIVDLIEAGGSWPAESSPRRKRKPMSPETKAKIAAARKKAWDAKKKKS